METRSSTRNNPMGQYLRSSERDISLDSTGPSMDEPFEPRRVCESVHPAARSFCPGQPKILEPKHPQLHGYADTSFAGSRSHQHILSPTSPWQSKSTDGQVNSPISGLEQHLSCDPYTESGYKDALIGCSLQIYQSESAFAQPIPLNSQLPYNDLPTSQYSYPTPTSSGPQPCEFHWAQISADPSSLSTNFAGCHVSEADCPQPDHRAAHALTVLRASYEAPTPTCFNGSMSSLCQPQLCTKGDCPPDTQIRCPSEDIETQRCDGNCAGRFCTGVNCPYYTACELSSPLQEHNIEHCNFSIDANQWDPHSYSFDCSTLVPNRHMPNCEDLGHSIKDSFACSKDDCCDLADMCEADICNYEDFCHFQYQGDECLWENCNVAAAGCNKQNDCAYLEQSTKNTVDAGPSLLPLSPTTWTLSPVSKSDLEGEEKIDGISCLWTTDQSSGQVCGLLCKNGNEMQAHIEQSHVNPQLARSTVSRKKASPRAPRLLVCRWKGCKHNLLKKDFRQTQGLRQHMFTHSGYKGAKCPECGELFVDKTNLEGHMRTHTGEKPFKCKFCPDSFAARSTLITHERTHTGEKVFTCDICGYKNGDSSNFARHKRNHKAPEFHCVECNKGFKRREHLTRHMNSIHAKRWSRQLQERREAEL